MPKGIYPTNKGKIPWNKGFCHLSDEAKQRIGEATKLRFKIQGHPRGMLGKHHTEATKRKIRKWRPTKEQRKAYGMPLEKHPLWKGRVEIKCRMCGKSISCRTTKIKKYCSCYCYHKFARGENSPIWKGGITKEKIRLRGQKRYKNWRGKVLKNDNYKCQNCGEREYLEVDHIKPQSLYPKLIYAVKNGRTLCKTCHIKTDTYGGKIKRFINKLNENPNLKS